MCVHQRETLAVVEFAIDVEGFDFEVETIDETGGLREDGAGGVAVSETVHRQRVGFVLHAGVECSVGVECGGSDFGFDIVEAISFVFITVVGSQMDINDALYLLREHFERILLKNVLPTVLPVFRSNFVRR